MTGQTTSLKTRSGFDYRYVILISAFLIYLVVWGIYYSFGIFFKPLLTEFGWTRAITSGAVSLSMVVYGVLGIIMGGLSDKFGPRIVLSISGILFGLGFLLTSQVSAVWQLYLFYGVMIGIAIGGTYVSVASTVARWFVQRRGMMMGIVTAWVGIGSWIGPQLANWLISTLAWRTTYLLLGGITMVVIVAAAQFMKRYPPPDQSSSANHQEAEAKLETWDEGFSLGEAVHTRQFWLIFGTYFCYGFCHLSIMVHLAAHATDLGISAATAASILATIGGASIFSKVILGSASDRIGIKTVVLIALSLMSAALLWATTANEVWMLYLFAATFGIAYGGVGTCQAPFTASLFGTRAHGLITGFVNNGYTIGGTIGPILAGYIFDATASYRLAFIICLALSTIGVILMTLLRPSVPSAAKSPQLYQDKA